MQYSPCQQRTPSTSRIRSRCRTEPSNLVRKYTLVSMIPTFGTGSVCHSASGRRIVTPEGKRQQQSRRKCISSCNGLGGHQGERGRTRSGGKPPLPFSGTKRTQTGPCRQSL